MHMALGRLDQTIELSTDRRAVQYVAEPPVFTSDDERPDRPFLRVAVDGQITRFGISMSCRPSIFL